MTNTNDTNRAELLPCPFCDGTCAVSKGFAIDQVWQHGEFHRVYCTSCQSRQLFHKTQGDAIAAWNVRAQPVEPTIESQLDSVTIGKMHTLITQGMKPVGIVLLADDGNRATIDMGRVMWTDSTAEDISVVEPQIDGYPLWSGLPPPAERVALSDEQIKAIAIDYAQHVASDIYDITKYDCSEDFFNCVRAILAVQADLSTQSTDAENVSNLTTKINQSADDL